jgi:hypothetical protein
MEPIIYSSHETVRMHPSLPKSWKGGLLSGSQPFCYDGPLGSAAVQKFRDEQFSICYMVADFVQKIKLFWNKDPLLRLSYVLNGKLQYKGTQARLVKLKEGQVNAAWAPDRETAISISKGKFEVFQIAVRPEVVQELLPGFPSIKTIPSETSRQWIGEERQRDIYDMLDVSYKADARRFFYGIKVK